MHRIISEVTHVSIEELERDGEPFAAVMEDFLKWCGEGLHILHLGKYGPYGTAEEHGLSWDDDPVPETVPFYDVQKLYSPLLSGRKGEISLDEAVESLCA